MMRPKEILQQWVNHFNNADAQAMTELYANDAINHQVANEPIVGKEAIGKVLKDEFEAVPMTCIVENMFEDGEWAIMEWKDPL